MFFQHFRWNISLVSVDIKRYCYFSRYLIARQLMASRGESFIKDLVNTSLNFLLPDDVKHDLESFDVPDALSVTNQKHYRESISSLDKVIAETYPGNGFVNALNNFRQVLI